ncbi:hypothetical protein KM803_13990 [Clostridium tyrobutyricum]|uniref:BRO-N domain-containing protein n=1 Tax=Clostridium tyrobutyricum TaxID=1519 RepID=UPI001C3952AA|nr:BRO family protein [Clostridium tyrobutyricum]MBV4432422.1 hypothetical protein [Clostridium tyrobutyricum]
MENNLMIFEEQHVEVFELNGVIYFNPYHVGNCLEMAESTVRNYLSKMNINQVKLIKNSDVHLKDIRKLNNAGEKFLTESGVYKLAFKSNKPNAEKFSDWVADEVLPSIRKTGVYSTEKSEQSKIQESYKMIKKFYNGSLVMVFKDLEFLTETSVHNISYIVRSNKHFTIGIDYFLLEANELKKFKKENNLSPWIGSLIVISKQGVYKLIDLLNLSEDVVRKIEEYFKIESPVSQSKAPVLEQLQACKFIADDLKMGEAIKMSIYRIVCEKNGIDTAVVDKIEHNKKLNMELKDITMKYGVYLLEHFTTNEIMDMKNQWISHNNVKSEKVKSYMIRLFDGIIKISTKIKKTA